MDLPWISNITNVVLALLHGLALTLARSTDGTVPFAPDSPRPLESLIEADCSFLSFCLFGFLRFFRVSTSLPYLPRFHSCVSSISPAIFLVLLSNFGSILSLSSLSGAHFPSSDLALPNY